MKVFLYSLLAWALFSGCIAVRCYVCGTGGDVESCELFDLAPSWKSFEADCPSEPAHGCVKTTTRHSRRHQGVGVNVTRGCTPLVTALGVPNAVGCARTSQVTTLCLCPSNLCNKAHHRHVGPTVSVAMFIVVFPHLF